MYGYTYLNTYMYMYSHMFIRVQTQMCVWTYIYRYIYTYVYVHMSKYIRSECCKSDRFPDRMVDCPEFLIIRSWQITSTHTQIHTRSNLGLSERTEFIRQFDCPKELDEVLFFSINMPKSSSCLENANQCIALDSTSHSNICYKNWTEGAKLIFVKIKLSLHIMIFI